MPDDARRDAARHHLLDRGAAEPRTFFVVRRAARRARAIVSMPPMPVPSTAPRVPVDGSSPGSGRARPASCPRLERGERTRSDGSRSSRAARPRRSAAARARRRPAAPPPTWQRSRAPPSRLDRAQPAQRPLRSARSNAGDAVRRSARPRRGRSPRRAASSRHSHARRAAPSRRACRPRASSRLDAQLAAPAEDTLRLGAHALARADDALRTRPCASVKSVWNFSASASSRSR